MDGRYLEIWQLLAEAGRARYVLVHDLGPATLDVNEAAAIASRVLEEDVLTTTLPLLDDDEGVIGVLDVGTREQYFPDGTHEAPRDDFSDAVEAETNTLFDAASAYMGVIRDRQIAVLRQRNLEFLEEQVRAARSRFDVGEGTRTDVEQARASRAGSRCTRA